MRRVPAYLNISALCIGALTSIGFAIAATSAQATTSQLRPTPQATIVTGSGSGPLLSVENDSTAAGAVGVKGFVENASSGVGVVGFGASFTLPEQGVLGGTFGPGGIGVFGRSYFAEPSTGPTTVNATAGLYGAANNGNGVVGVTVVQHSPTGGEFAGIQGVDATSNSGNNVGVFGSTENGYFGVEGVGGSGSVGGVYGAADNGSFGVFGESATVGVEGSSDTTPLAASNSSGAVVWSVNGTGVVTTTGTVQAILNARGGASARTFVPTTTTPLLEDVGSATLVRGASTVRLDPAFGSSISNAVYQVFLTPSGESNGLYVAQKSANQFVVRENAGGHSTIGFDYRIVAKPFADSGKRIALGHAAADFGLPVRPYLRSSGMVEKRFPTAESTRAVQRFLLKRRTNAKFSLQ